MKVTYLLTGPAEWVGQQGYAPVDFKILLSLEAFNRKKVIKIGWKLTELEENYLIM